MDPASAAEAANAGFPSPLKSLQPELRKLILVYRPKGQKLPQIGACPPYTRIGSTETSGRERCKTV
jgi:hypothetical protein